MVYTWWEESWTASVFYCCSFPGAIPAVAVYTVDVIGRTYTVLFRYDVVYCFLLFGMSNQSQTLFKQKKGSEIDFCKTLPGDPSIADVLNTIAMLSKNIFKSEFYRLGAHNWQACFLLQAVITIDSVNIVLYTEYSAGQGLAYQRSFCRFIVLWGCIWNEQFTNALQQPHWLAECIDFYAERVSVADSTNVISAFVSLQTSNYRK